MSIKTTYFVTREFAIEAIKKKKENPIAKKRIKDYRNQYYSGYKLKELKDYDLEDILEIALHDGFKNFSIISEESLNEYKNQNNMFGGFWLDNIDYLPEENDAY